MTKILAAYAAAILVLMMMDFVWIGFIAMPMYQQGIGHLMAPQPNLAAAVVFYLVFAAGLMVFAVLPNRFTSAWRKTLVAGALYGFFTYATYELTNLATLKDWPVSLVLIDLVWGSLISTVGAAVGKAAWGRVPG